ncbi:hypothetical protein [Natrarchaeobius oligotrophus]|uniref:Uncharacterized protein n=1 Tax=Natrarchaeobius chitinivorans TaxID=1679083 RepID=A0A3N6NC34_NATCH|nr:hypothetical protein [Natrarchaeobius chitinivorans]RQG96262.1 hypothetical protein EA472_20625 [Natrarchaeobius chitinivorans]
MDRFTRRDALLATGSVGIGAIAGCLEDPRTGGENGSGNGDTGGNGSAGTGGDGDVTAETFQLGPTLSRPLWHEHEDGRTGFLTVLESDRDAPWMIDDPDEIDGLEEWYGETDFSESVLVYVQTVGPNTCYSEVDVRDVAVSADALGGEESERAITATARPVDVSDEGEACGEAVTYPAAFVRVTGDELPSAAAFEITDGWGETETVDSTGGLLDPDGLPGFVRPTHDPETVPDALSCDADDFERLRSPDDGDVAWGETAGDDGEALLAMRVENPQYDGDDERQALAFERGDEVRIRVRNVSDGTVTTGNRNKYSLEVSTADGWMDVRGAVDDAPIAYTDEGIIHPPGEGFEWTLTLSESGVLEDDVHGEHLEICPDLPDGRYRFVFWGGSGDGVPAVAFDLVG